MGLGARLSTLLKAKASKALDRAEDPREILDYSYEKQLELLTKTRRGVADVATSRKRLELQMQKLNENGDTLQKQAQQALQAGREDLAREALTRRAGLQQQVASLQAQRDQLEGQEKQLIAATERLSAKVEAFRTQKETIKATYTAAEAQTKISESVSGLSEEMGDVTSAMQRAQDKTAQMQARAGAMDELLASGALSDATEQLPGGDDISRQLAEISAGSDIDAQLAAMKGELGATPAPAPIEGSSS
ncbi:MAG TPA: PspA/IM30 family protein [Mycobacteriales bacterium]|jgi:phage shock protein A|nr:PspA/IM30 family protein [Mycobacteriales bacterium]